MSKNLVVALALSIAGVIGFPGWSSANDRRPIVLAEFAHQRAEGAILELVRESSESVRILTTSMVNKDLADELVLAQRRGVDVRVLFSGAGRDHKSFVVAFLINSGVVARYTVSSENFNSNFIVADGHVVQVGSVDYSSNAFRRNHETILIVRHAPEAAEQLLRAWNALDADAEEAHRGHR